MKQITSLLLVLILIFASIIPSYAKKEENELTMDEAKRLIADGYNLYIELLSYAIGNSDLKEYQKRAKTIFIDSVAEKAMTLPDPPPDDMHHNVYFYENGEVRRHEDLGIPCSVSFYLVCPHWSDSDIENRNYQIWLCVTDDIDLTFQKRSRDFVQAEVKIYYRCYMVDHPEVPIKVTIEFTRTEEGWRISGGEFLEILNNQVVDNEFYSSRQFPSFFKEKWPDFQKEVVGFSSMNGFDLGDLYQIALNSGRELPFRKQNRNCNFDKTEMCSFSYQNEKDEFGVILDKYENGKKTGEKVVMTIGFKWNDNFDGVIMYGPFYDYCVNGNDNVEYITYEEYLKQHTSPATGDEDVTRAAVFSVAAVLALCALVPTFCSGRKRRKIAE